MQTYEDGNTIVTQPTIEIKDDHITVKIRNMELRTSFQHFANMMLSGYLEERALQPPRPGSKHVYSIEAKVG